MPISKAWMRRLAIAAVLVAAPAFAFLTFDALIAGTNTAVSRPTLVETLVSVPKPVRELIRGAGERLRGTEDRRAAPVAPPPAAPPLPALPSELAIPILVYHNVREVAGRMPPARRPYDVTPSEIEAQFAYLETEGFTAISPDDLVAALDGAAALPPKPVLITFDDGRDTQFKNAYPSLVRHGLTATFYIFTNAIDQPRYLTWDQLKELRDAGMTVGSHTIIHPYLTSIDDDELHRQLMVSKATLEEGLQGPVKAFAYPFGLYDGRVIEAVRAAGYSTARGLDHGIRVGKDDLLALPGHVVTGDLAAFKAILAGGRR